jgi:DNA-binding NtrC family response regulator
MFGRGSIAGPNADRDHLCASFLWSDATGDAAACASRQRVLRPMAEAVFCRGQRPVAAGVGDVVENDAAGAMTAVRAGWAEALAEGRPRWAMVLLDLCFYTGRVTEASDRRTPGMPEGRAGDDDPRSYFGLTLLDAIHREFPELPVFILSSKPREEVSLEFSQRGAIGFIDRTDPNGPELLQEALLRHGLLEDAKGSIVGRSLPLLLALREARRAALHRHHLLIGGERGAGKELLANYIHEHGRADGPFVPVNSAIFTPQLFSSEFFGIEAGTATGVTAKKGLIEAADGGDLFLDEVADLPDEAQAGILRVLQDGHFMRVGGMRSRKVDVRVIAATNSDVRHPDSGFRADLLDRLRTGGFIALPPLRERLDDIPLLAESVVREAEKAHRGARPREISEEALQTLASHHWLGNIRELRTVLFDAVNRFPDVEHLVPGHLRIEARRTAVPVFKVVPAAASKAPAACLSALLDALRGVEFDPLSVAQWMGQLRTLQHEQARVAARLLSAAIEATKRRTPEHPDGLIQIQPAAKLATGDRTLTASKAADLFKRTLGPIADELDGDLLEAYQIALRLRPRSGGGTRSVDP